MINIGGTVYRLHPLFVLLMISSVLTGYFVEMITLFGVVTIHELGHVAAAKSLGWRVREVQLLPFGGVASVDEQSNVPAREDLLVAICGPLQNVWMAAFAYGMMAGGWGNEAYWQYFLKANMMIGIFNLLPALPLDGGKIMQALLSYMISFHRALVVSTYLSMLLSIMVIIAAVIRYPSGGIQLNLLVIGIFLFYTNWYGYKHLSFQFLRFLVSREGRSERMMEGGKLPSPLLVPSDARPMEVFRQFMREKHHLLYMTGNTGAVMRVLPEAVLVRAFLESTPPSPPRAEVRRFPYDPPVAPKIG